MLASVAAAGSYDKVVAMTVTRGFVYFTKVNGSNNPLGLFRVPIDGGAPELVVPVEGEPCNLFRPFAYGNLASDGRYVFGAASESKNCTGYSKHISAYDTNDDTWFQLPVPAVANSKPRVLAPRATLDGGAAWVINPGTYEGPTVLARWSGGPVSTIAFSLPVWVTSFVLAGNDAFVSTRDSGIKTLRYMSLTSSTLSEPETVGPDFRLLGANNNAIFYTPDGTTLSRRDVASGVVTALGAPKPRAGLWVDDDFLYLGPAEGVTSSAAVVMRRPASGGPAVEIYRDDSRRRVDAITADSCNVYWAVGRSYDDGNSQPVAIFARRR